VALFALLLVWLERKREPEQRSLSEWLAAVRASSDGFIAGMPWRAPEAWRRREQWIPAQLTAARTSAGNEGLAAAARAMRAVASVPGFPDQRDLQRYLAVALRKKDGPGALRGVASVDSKRHTESSSRALYLAPSVAALLDKRGAELKRELEAASSAVRSDRRVAPTARTVPRSDKKPELKAKLAAELEYSGVLELELDDATEEMGILDRQKQKEQSRAKRLRDSQSKSVRVRVACATAAADKKVAAARARVQVSASPCQRVRAWFRVRARLSPLPCL
jgi:hypothetical protein